MPKLAKDPANPMRTRHVARIAKAEQRAELHDARGNLALIERDTQRVLEWMASDPLRTITSAALRQWVREQTPPWTNGYWQTVKERVDQVLLDATGATAISVKARLLAMIDNLLPLCRTYKTGNGGHGTGTVILEDPRKGHEGELLTEIDHTAAQGYIDRIARLTGAVSEEHRIIHLHAAMRGGDLAEVPEAELEEAMAVRVRTTEPQA